MRKPLKSEHLTFRRAIAGLSAVDAHQAGESQVRQELRMNVPLQRPRCYSYRLLQSSTNSHV